MVDQLAVEQPEKLPEAATTMPLDGSSATPAEVTELPPEALVEDNYPDELAEQDYYANSTTGQIEYFEDPREPMSDEVATEGSLLMSSFLTGETRTADDLALAYARDVTGPMVREALELIKAQEGEITKEAILDVMSSSDLDPTGRAEAALALRETIASEMGYDPNAILRQRAYELSIIEDVTSDFAVDSDGLREQRLEAIDESMPPGSEVVQDGMYLSTDAQAQTVNEIAAMYELFEEDKNLGDFGAVIVTPGLALGVWNEVSKIINPEGSTAGRWFMNVAAQGELVSDLKIKLDRIMQDDPEEGLKKVREIADVIRKTAVRGGSGNAYIGSEVVMALFEETLMGRGANLTPAQRALAAEADATALEPQFRAEFEEKYGAGRTDDLYVSLYNRSWNAEKERLKEQYSGTARNSMGTRIIGNIFGMLDALYVGQVIKWGAKTLGRASNTVLNTMSKAAPKQSAQIVGSTLADNTDALAKRMGITKAELAERLLPGMAAQLSGQATDGTLDVIARALSVGDQLSAVASKSSLTMQQRVEAAAEINELYRNTTVMANHLGSSVTKVVDDGIQHTGVYGQTSTEAFTTFAQAEAAALQTFGRDTGWSVLRKHPKTGELVPVTRGNKGSYVVSADMIIPFESATKTVSALSMEGAIKANRLGLAISRWTGTRAAGTLLDPSAFNPMAQFAQLEKKWRTLSGKLLIEVGQTTTAQRQIIANLMKTSTKSGAQVTYKEMVGAGLDASGIAAYSSIRTANEVMFKYANNAARKRMLRDGLSEIVSPSGRVAWGKVVDDVATIDVPRNGPLTVWDGRVGALVQVTRAELDTMYKAGTKLARMSSPIVKRDGEAVYTLVDGVHTKSWALPSQVIDKIDNYYPHIQKANYVLYGVTHKGTRVAIGLGRKESDFAKRIAVYNKTAAARAAVGKKPTTYARLEAVPDSSLSDVGRMAVAVDDVYTNLGGAVFGAREGGFLRNFARDYGDTMLDPVEATIRGMQIVGGAVTKGELIDNMSSKLVTFVDKFGLRSPNARTRAGRILDRGDIATDQQVLKAYQDQARAYFDKIQEFAAIPDNVESFMRGVMTQASTMFMEAGNKSKSSFVKKLSYNLEGLSADIAASGTTLGMNPLRELVFRATMSHYPTRHLALGITQSLLVAGLSPRAYTTAVATVSSTGILYAMKVRAVLDPSLEAAYRKAIKDHAKILNSLPFGKKAKITDVELAKMVDEMYSSGLVDSVAHTTLLNTAWRDSAMERVIRTSSPGVGAAARAQGAVAGGVEAARKVSDIGTKIGFEAGESANRMIVYTTLFLKDKLKGVADMANPDYVSRLIGRTTELTGAMLPELTPGITRGVLRNAMQFTDFSMKMLQLTLPKKLGGSKVLDDWEWAQLALGQTLLFGSKATVYGDHIARALEQYVQSQYALDPSDPTWQYLTSPEAIEGFTGGAVDVSINGVLSTLLGREVNLAVSDTVAPTKGYDFPLDAVMSAAKNTHELFGLSRNNPLLGLSGVKGSEWAAFMDKTLDYSLAYADAEWDGEMTKDKALVLADAFGKAASSQYSKGMAALAAYKMQGYMNKAGGFDPQAVEVFETALFALFGIATRDREALNDLMDYERDNLLNSEYKADWLSKIAKTHTEDLVRESALFYKQTDGIPELYNELEGRWIRDREVILSALEPADRDTVSRKIIDNIAKLKDGTDTEQAFYQRFFERAANIGTKGGNALAKLHADPNVPAHIKADIARQYELMYSESEETGE